MPLTSSTYVRLSRLRFPFAVRVQAEQGGACLRDANGRREVHPGDPFVVPAFAHFGCDLLGTPWQPITITLAAVPDASCPRMAAIHHDKPWSRILANLVFEHPAGVWNAATLSERWQTGTRQLRARLFAEGEAFNALVREQRAAQALYALASLEGSTVPSADKLEMTETLKTLARQSGWQSINALNATCANLFGIELERLMPAYAATSDTTEHAGSATWTGWDQPLALRA